jgi:hypothetical protein
MASETKSPDTSEQPFVHTPGPWVAHDYEGHEHDNAWAGDIKSESGEVVYSGPFCFWSLQGRGHKQAKANALLMATSPELLECLESLIELYEQDDETTTPGTDAYTAMTLAKIVVAKARGTLVV